MNTHDSNTPTTAAKPPSHLPTSLCPPLLLFQMMYRPLQFLIDVGSQFDLVRLGWMGSPFYLVAEPELVRELLADPKRFQKGFMFKKLQMVLGKGLVTLDGKDWIDARRRIQQAFSRGMLAQQQEIVIRQTQAAIERLSSHAHLGPIDLDRVTTELMLRVALELLFGAEPEQFDLAEAGHAVDVCNAYARYRMWSLVPEGWNTPRKRRFDAALACLEGIVSRVIEQRRNESRAARSERCDALSLLFEAGFDGVELRDHVMTMFIAGHETTAGTVAFLLGLLARHGAIQDRVYEEVRDLPADAVPLASVPWTEAVWKETLRLYPSVPMLDRMAVADTHLGPYAIPAGANLIWSPWVMHRKYFERPEAFDPARFLAREKSVAGLFIPFGEGPRLCIGKPLADMEGVTITALLMRAFRIEPADAAELSVRPMITLRPKNGFLARLTPRRRPEEQREPSEEQVVVGA